MHLVGYQVPYVMDYLSREILLRADTPLLFQQMSRPAMVRSIGKYFSRKGTLPVEIANEVHESCGLYRRWLRSLNDPIVPMIIQRRVIQRLNCLEDPEDWHFQRLVEILLDDGDLRLTLWRICFLHCIFFLQQIARYKERNFMTPRSLAAIFANDLFRYEALETLHRPSMCTGELNKDDIQRGYYATQQKILLQLINFLDYLISGRANRALVRIIRRMLDDQKNLDTIAWPDTGSSSSSSSSSGLRLPVIPAAARDALIQEESEPVLLLWRSHNFDSVPSIEEHSPLRMTFLREYRTTAMMND